MSLTHYDAVYDYVRVKKVCTVSQISRSMKISLEEAGNTCRQIMGDGHIYGVICPGKKGKKGYDVGHELVVFHPPEENGAGCTEIYFKPKYMSKIIRGHKRATTRDKIVGCKGKVVLYLGGGIYQKAVITDIKGLAKEKACEEYYGPEGYSSAAEMSADLSQIYPHISDVDTVYVHEWDTVGRPYSTPKWGWQ